MAEAIGAASAITTFVTLALQATVTLYQTIQSIQTREKPIRELREELQDLTEVLKALNELTGSTGTEIDLAALERPLKRCASACRDFNVLVMECTKHSSADRYSKRDWLKIQYMKNDISGFRNMLEGYKSTIKIALEYVTLRANKITKHVFDEYKELILNTQCDLESHLEDIRTHMQTLSGNGSATTTRIDRAELQRMEDEILSTQKSLDFCQQTLTLLNQSQSRLLAGPGSAPNETSRRLSSPRERPMQSSLIKEGWNSARNKAMGWKIQPLQNPSKADNQLSVARLDRAPPRNHRLDFEQQALQKEVRGAGAILEFCKRAGTAANQPGTNHYEDITVGDDSTLVIVSTPEDLISAKHIKLGNGSRLVLGQMSDGTIQRNISVNTAGGGYTR